MHEFNLRQVLTQIAPTSKAAKLRQVMPVIEQKIAAGVRIADILAALNAGGLDLDLGTLKNYLYRYRSTRKRLGEPRGEMAVALPTSERPPVDATVVAEQPSEDERGARVHEPVSMQELDRLIHPDPVQQAQEMARYERIGKQLLKGRKS